MKERREERLHPLPRMGGAWGGMSPLLRQGKSRLSEGRDLLAKAMPSVSEFDRRSKGRGGCEKNSFWFLFLWRNREKEHIIIHYYLLILNCNFAVCGKINTFGFAELTPSRQKKKRFLCFALDFP